MQITIRTIIGSARRSHFNINIKIWYGPGCVRVQWTILLQVQTHTLTIQNTQCVNVGETQLSKNGVHNKSETHAPFRIAETREDCCRGERKSLHNQRPLISLICSQLGFWWSSSSSNSNWGCCVCCSLSSLSDESPNTSLKSALLLLWSSISIWLKMILTRLWERERDRGKEWRRISYRWDDVVFFYHFFLFNSCRLPSKCIINFCRLSSEVLFFEVSVFYLNNEAQICFFFLLLFPNIFIWFLNVITYYSTSK